MMKTELFHRPLLPQLIHSDTVARDRQPKMTLERIRSSWNLRPEGPLVEEEFPLALASTGCQGQQDRDYQPPSTKDD